MSKSHGYTNTRVYTAWKGMKRRCFSKDPLFSAFYGNKGITVCERWLHSFENFLADMGEPPEGRPSLDRIDPDGDYCPENCRWADLTIQARNLSHKNSRFGHRGVNEHRGRFRAYLYVRRKQIYLGSFGTADEAIDARKKGEIEHWGAMS